MGGLGEGAMHEIVLGICWKKGRFGSQAAQKGLRGLLQQNEGREDTG